MFFINNILILDICKCINAMFIIKKIINIQTDNLTEISKMFKDANIMSTISAKNYFIQMGVVLVVNIVFGRKQTSSLNLNQWITVIMFRTKFSHIYIKVINYLALQF